MEHLGFRFVDTMYLSLGKAVYLGKLESGLWGFANWNFPSYKSCGVTCALGMPFYIAGG